MTATELFKAAPQRIVILGALSAIAERAARLWAARGATMVLVGRNTNNLNTVAADLRLRGAAVEIFADDFDPVGAQRALPELVKSLGGVDIVLVAYGYLGDQRRAEIDEEEALRILRTNFLSAAGWCLKAAEILERQQFGTLIVIGSVAGDRGRASNYIYGAAKGGLGILVQGLAHRLARSNARAILIKPGFVDTPMTASMSGKGLLWSKPESIAAIIVRAGMTGTSKSVITYAPWFWRWIMIVVRMVPTGLFHRTEL